MKTTPTIFKPVLSQAALFTVLAFSLSLASCDNIGYEYSSIIDDPQYQYGAAASTELQPMPNFGVAAGDLDSVLIVTEELSSGDSIFVDSIRTAWTYLNDSVYIVQQSYEFFREDPGNFTFEDDTQIWLPEQPDLNGETVGFQGEYDSFDQQYDKDYTRVTTRSNGQITAVDDYELENDGTRILTRSYRYERTASGKVLAEIIQVESTASFDYLKDSIHYSYDALDSLVGFETFNTTSPSTPLTRENDGNVSYPNGGFRHVFRNDFNDSTYYFFGPNAIEDGFEVDGNLFTRSDNRDDSTVRSYSYSDASTGFSRTYTYHYREPISTSTKELQQLGASLTSSNPIRAGEQLSFTDVPAGARYGIFDIQGRLIVSNRLAIGASQVAFPDVKAGLYVVQLEATGYQSKSWKFVAQ